MAGTLNNNTGYVEYTCDGCGRNMGINSSTPYKGFGTHFCSIACKRNVEDRNPDTPQMIQSTSISDREEGRSYHESQRRNIEAQTEYLNQQAESERQQNNQRRADELRHQGKPFQAFMTEHSVWGWVGLVGFIFGCVIFVLIMNYGKEDKQMKASKINTQLEQIEDQIKLAIEEGNKRKALDLANKLHHPSNEIYEGKGTMFTPEQYDTYWDKKREKYKEEIIKMPSAHNRSIKNTASTIAAPASAKEELSIDTSLIESDTTTL